MRPRLLRRGDLCRYRRQAITDIASMRPRLLRRGDSPGARDYPSRPDAASMRPRLLRRGDSLRASYFRSGGNVGLCCGWRASMRPRLLRRGDTGSVQPAAIKTTCFNEAPAASPGRSAVTHDTDDAGQDRFNEAPAASPGRYGPIAPLPDLAERASMRPRLLRRGDTRAAWCVASGRSPVRAAIRYLATDSAIVGCWKS